MQSRGCVLSGRAPFLPRCTWMTSYLVTKEADWQHLCSEYLQQRLLLCISFPLSSLVVLGTRVCVCVLFPLSCKKLLCNRCEHRPGSLSEKWNPESGSQDVQPHLHIIYLFPLQLSCQRRPREESSSGCKYACWEISLRSAEPTCRKASVWAEIERIVWNKRVVCPTHNWSHIHSNEAMANKYSHSQKFACTLLEH